MSVKGPYLPNSGASLSVLSFGSITDWANPENITAEGGSVATLTIPMMYQVFGKALCGHGFNSGSGFGVPAGSSITNVKVEAKMRSSTAVSEVGVTRVRLMNGTNAGDVIGTEQILDNTLFNNDMTLTWYTIYDGGTLGATLTDSIVNSAGFGVAIGIWGSDNYEFGDTIECDAIRMTLTYTDGSGAIGQVVMISDL